MSTQHAHAVNSAPLTPDDVIANAELNASTPEQSPPEAHNNDTTVAMVMLV